MSSLAFIVALALFLGATYWWGFSRLAGENWQFIGTRPLQKEPEGTWLGVNFTFYGLFNANACTLATGVVFVLLTAAGVSEAIVALICLLLIGICAPSAKWVARWVEGKPHTLSIGGAAFVGVLLLPWLLLGLNCLLLPLWGIQLPVMMVMAAVSIGYALGEGYGRLACISFGCCYGRPLAQLPDWLRPGLAPFSVVYHGKTKKIAYADGWEGQRVVAVPAMTAVIYSAAALAGIYLYLDGRPVSAYLVGIGVTQLWRAASEFLRADYRGGGRVSSYQFMALIAAGHSAIIAFLLPAEIPGIVVLDRGLGAIWHPLPLLLLQILWCAIFLYTGRSNVTGARIALFTHQNRI